MIVYEVNLRVDAGIASDYRAWLVAHVEEAKRELGDDYWSYGFQQNRKVLETFLRYSFEQGLSKRLLTLEDIFVPETMEAFVI